MDPAAGAPKSRDAVDPSTSTSSFGFPSPAPSDVDILTPGLERGPQHIAGLPSLCSQRLIDPLLAETSSVLAPEPETVKHEQVVTPAHELQAPLSFDTAVGAAVDPAPSDPHLSSSTAAKAPGLRLPSFAKLGIAAPHSEFLPPTMLQSPLSSMDVSSDYPDFAESEDGAGAASIGLSDLSESLRDLIVALPGAGSPRAQARVVSLHSPLQHYVTTLTPPDDNGRITWESITKVATGPMNSPSGDADTVRAEAAEVTPVAAPATAPATAPGIVFSLAERETRPSWVREITRTMLTNLHSAEHVSSPIKVLSHALPTPSAEGHLFPKFIDSLHDQTPSSPTCWINVFHALPGKFNLADLPTSPPSTPGPAIGGDDYFTAKIFDSAVPVLDYQLSLQGLPQSPRPIVPPSSVDVSIVERYIPPSSANEFSGMFDMRGPSILLDRLVELSPDNGSLIFIYPTKRGAKTFMDEYLGPIMEPLLRSIIVINGLSADFASATGRMAAVDALPDHESMKRKVISLCAQLSQASPRMEKFARQQATFSVVYAAQEEVQLERKVWADSWWCKQEKPRIRDIVSRHFRMANRADHDKTPSSLVQEILSSVAQNPYREGREPQSGIEVSAFVIKRSR